MGQPIGASFSHQCFSLSLPLSLKAMKEKVLGWRLNNKWIKVPNFEVLLVSQISTANSHLSGFFPPLPPDFFFYSRSCKNKMTRFIFLPLQCNFFPLLNTWEQLTAGFCVGLEVGIRKGCLPAFYPQMHIKPFFQTRYPRSLYKAFW